MLAATPANDSLEQCCFLPQDLQGLHCGTTQAWMGDTVAAALALPGTLTRRSAGGTCTQSSTIQHTIILNPHVIH